jgi:hypothetical protein
VVISSIRTEFEFEAQSSSDMMAFGSVYVILFRGRIDNHVTDHLTNLQPSQVIQVTSIN